MDRSTATKALKEPEPLVGEWTLGERRGAGHRKGRYARLGNGWGWIVAYGVASLLARVGAVLWPSSTLVVIEPANR
jgi:hypothetical protein